MVDAFVMYTPRVTHDLVRTTGFDFLHLIIACQQTNDSYIVENACRLIAKRIHLADVHHSRLEEDLHTAYDKKRMDSQVDQSNGPLEILHAGMRILKDARGHKRTYENIPRDRSLPSVAWEGKHTGCSVPSERLYRRQLAISDGPHARFLECLRHETTRPYREAEDKARHYNESPCVVASEHVSNGNRCPECYSDTELMGLAYIVCRYKCNDCPFIDMKMRGLKMIQDIAKMTKHDRQLADIKDDPIYEMYSNGESMAGNMSRIEAVVIAHKAVALHIDRKTKYAGPVAKSGRETAWEQRFSSDLSTAVEEATPTFVMTRLPTDNEAGAKGEHMKVFCIVGTIVKKTERRTSLWVDACRIASTRRIDARDIVGKVATEVEMAEKGRAEGCIAKKVTPKDGKPLTQQEQADFEPTKLRWQRSYGPTRKQGYHIHS